MNRDIGVTGRSDGFIEHKDKPVHKHRAYVYAVPHRYHDDGEEPYVKWGCPVCEALGDRFSFARGTENCPCCNVRLAYEE